MKIRVRNRTHSVRKGMMVTIVVLLMGISANTMAVKFWSDSHDQYMASKVVADGFRAQQMAVAGFHAGLSALKVVPEEFLFQAGIALEPPDIILSKECKPHCMISYRLQPEDGKLNVNNLIIPQTDEPNDRYRKIFERFFRNYNFQEPEKDVDSIIDWLDENTRPEAGGAEGDYYSDLSPPVKIKNFQLFSLSEICQIKGLDYNKIYSSQMPPDWKEIQEELKFQTEEEKALIQEADWIPSNNLSAYIPVTTSYDQKININAARYHVLMSLSDSMSKEAVLALFKLRTKSGNYIKNIQDLNSLPEFQVKFGELTLYEELAGSGGALSGIIKTSGEIYRVVGVGSILPFAENERVKPVIRSVTGLYDLKAKKLIYYSED